MWGSLRVAKRQLICMVLLSVLFKLPAFFERRLIFNYPMDGMMAFSDNALVKSRLYLILYKSLLFYIVSYILPIIGLTYMTIALIVSLRKAYKKRQTMTSQVTSGSEDKRREITLTLIIIVVIFTIAHCLHPVRRILVMIYPDASYQACGQFIFYLNTSIVISI